MELKLKYPFTAPSGQKIETVTLRRLKVRDIKIMSEQSGGKPDQMELLGVARMANLVLEDVDEMDAADYQVLKERFLDVLGITGDAMGGSGATGTVVPVSPE